MPRITSIAGQASSGGPSGPSLLHTLDNPNDYDTSASDNFGSSAAISGNYAIVGARYEDDAGGAQSGKAYIFNVTTGNLLHTLDNPNSYSTSAGDQFGEFVAINGTLAIVGAPREASNVGPQEGAAYIFNVTTGALVHTLTNPNAYGGGSGDRFGSAVAIHGSYAIVGAYAENDANGNDSGKAYIFNTSTGALVTTLDNPNPYDTGANDWFGFAVGISTNYAIVGAYGEDEAGNQFSGKAYVYTVPNGNLVHTLDNPNDYGTSAADGFARSLDISGNYAIVSAYNEDDADGNDSGKVYIFNAQTGSLVHTLDNPNAYGTSANDQFGNSVAIDGDRAIVGAWGEDEGAFTSSGKAYIYDVTTGTLLATLDNPNAYSTANSDYFSYNAVGISSSSNRAIVGAILEDDAPANASGKAYLFNL